MSMPIIMLFVVMAICFIIRMPVSFSMLAASITYFLLAAPDKLGQVFTVMSDKLEADKEVTLLLRVMDFNGKVLTKKSIKGEVPANASTLYYKEPYAGITTSPQNTFLLMTLKNKKGEVLSEEIYYFNHAKDQELPKTEIRYKVKPMDGKYEVTLSARQLARDVFIEIPVQGARFTDNFFDLLPGQTKKVIITSDKLKKNEKVDITIKQLSDTN